MALKSKSLKKSLEQAAVENATVTRGTRSKQTVLKEGKPNDHSAKHIGSIPFDAPVVGAALGMTLNMDNYESLRADVWLTDVVQPGETIEQAYARVVQVLDSTIQTLTDQYRT